MDIAIINPSASIFAENRCSFSKDDSIGIRYYHTITALILSFFFPDKICEVRDNSGAVWFLDKASLRDYQSRVSTREQEWIKKLQDPVLLYNKNRLSLLTEELNSVSIRQEQFKKLQELKSTLQQEIHLFGKIEKKQIAFEDKDYPFDEAPDLLDRIEEKEQRLAEIEEQLFWFPIDLEKRAEELNSKISLVKKEISKFFNYTSS